MVLYMPSSYPRSSLLADSLYSFAGLRSYSSTRSRPPPLALSLSLSLALSLSSYSHSAIQCPPSATDGDYAPTGPRTKVFVMFYIVLGVVVTTLTTTLCAQQDMVWEYDVYLEDMQEQEDMVRSRLTKLGRRESAVQPRTPRTRARRRSAAFVAPNESRLQKFLKGWDWPGAIVSLVASILFLFAGTMLLVRLEGGSQFTFLNSYVHFQVYYSVAVCVRLVLVLVLVMHVVVFVVCCRFDFPSIQLPAVTAVESCSLSDLCLFPNHRLSLSPPCVPLVRCAAPPRAHSFRSSLDLLALSLQPPPPLSQLLLHRGDHGPRRVR